MRGGFRQFNSWKSLSAESMKGLQESSTIYTINELQRGEIGLQDLNNHIRVYPLPVGADGPVNLFWDTITVMVRTILTCKIYILFLQFISSHFFEKSENKFVSTLSVKLFPYSVFDKGGEPKVLEDMFD